MEKQLISSRLSHFEFARIRVLLFLAFLSGGVCAWSQDEIVNGNLQISGETVEHNNRYTHFLDHLSGRTDNPTVDSKRHEVARLTVNSHHWARTGPIEVEMYESYYSSDGYLKFIITAGYHNFHGAVTLVERRGNNLRANVTLGERVATGYDYAGYPNYYIPVYVDLGYYSGWDVKISHGWDVTNDDVPTVHSRIKVYDSPSWTLLENYVPSPSGVERIGNRYLYAGRIGIGTDDLDDSELAVAGTIRAEEVIVEAQPWADYVFEEGYELKSLGEVEAYIEQEGRLPGIPSAEEVAEKGVSIGETQRLLLEKIEELTLHVIELEKRLDEKDGQLAKLQGELFEDKEKGE